MMIKIIKIETLLLNLNGAWASLFRLHFQESLAYSSPLGHEACGVTAAPLETMRGNTLPVPVVDAGISRDQSNHLFPFP